MKPQYIDRKELTRLLDRLQEEYRVFAPVQKGEARIFQRYPGDPERDGPLSLEEARTFEPVKLFYFKARQLVAQGYADGVPDAGQKPLCLLGVKACDLKGLEILDQVFSGTDYRDPLYLQAREEGLIVSADCTSALDVCFCLAFHGRPYPQSGFDINLSEVDSGFIAEAGSGKGARILESSPELFREASGERLQQREARRARVEEAVRDRMRENHIPDQDLLDGLVQRNFEAALWQEEADTCVECGACNAICPTCHCFLLYDQTADDRLARFRLWDSCLIKDFAQVAGGANPRPRLWMRLRNRFDKKFNFFPAVYQRYGCTGCGRCILACPGKIDIRHVLRRNVEYVSEQ
jgi:ferredoxin